MCQRPEGGPFFWQKNGRKQKERVRIWIVLLPGYYAPGLDSGARFRVQFSPGKVANSIGVGGQFLFLHIEFH